jgi:DNA primase
MQFTNHNFQLLYYTLLEKLNQNQEFDIKNFIQQLDQNMSQEVVSILMEEEKYTLHDWERKQIVPKTKTQSLSQLVTQTILSLRCFLIDKKVKNYQYETTLENSSNQSILEDVKDYLGLKMLLSRKLGQVVGGKI